MVYIALLVAIVLAGADQYIKHWVAVNLAGGLPMQFIKFGDTEVINLHYYENTGAAFSMLEGKTGFLSVVTAIALLAGVFLLVSKTVKNKLLIWSIALMLGGGIGNLIDRIFRGYVIDYIEIKLFQFAVFNFADCCVVIGAIMLMIYALFLDNGDNVKAAAEKCVMPDDITEDESDEESDSASEDGVKPEDITENAAEVTEENSGNSDE